MGSAEGGGGVKIMYPTMTMPKMLTMRQAADYFGVGRNTLYKAIHAEQLKAYLPNGRDFLLKADEVAAWIETCRYSAFLPDGRTREAREIR